MNKLFVVLTIAIAAVALANAHPMPNEDEDEDEMSQLSLSPDDDTETDGLTGTNLAGFRDFCIQTRDYVYSDLKDRMQNEASSSFNAFFKSIGEVGQSSLDATNKATQKLSNQLRNPETAVDENQTEQVDKIIAEAQLAIQNAGNMGQSAFAAFMGGIKSFAAAGYGQTVAKVQELSDRLKNQFSLTETLVHFCEQLSSYEAEAMNIFETVKSDLVAEDKEQYGDVTYAQVAPKCITANRLSRAEGFCKFILTVKTPLAKVMGFSTN